MIGPSNILLYDEQVIFADALHYFLENAIPMDLKIVGKYNKYTCHNASEDEDVGFIITDLILGDEESEDFLPKMRKEYPEARIIVLSAYSSPKYVKNAMLLGAYGFVSKQNDFSELIKCLHKASQNETYIAKGLRITPAINSLKDNFSASEESTYEDKFQLRQKLTKREREVLGLIIDAKTNREIGETLYISYQTVGVHRKNIMRKLGVNSTINLIKYAIENQVV